MSLVWKPVESRSATSGIVGRLPAAMTMRSAVMVSPVPVSIVWASRNFAVPS